MNLVELCKEYVARLKIEDTLYDKASSLRSLAREHDSSLKTKRLIEYPPECVEAQREANAYWEGTKELVERIKSQLKTDNCIILPDGTIFARHDTVEGSDLFVLTIVDGNKHDASTTL